ncbi:MAG: bifunctional phosphopantothenoylcysteine decarboxylase/phosphopantothenate--cysteine ligase CoaBC [Thermoplasmata archaeon]|nr:bifunctional phosphopantothenoylcysteine decarboxylase/phosphopantothenate--cysteine ligase CoaBC [Thermoplasmata archaeon]
MHPSEAIRGRRSQLLAGRRIILGVTASIAAIEVPRIIRELIRHGADVRVVMSPEASRLVTAESLQFASGHPPISELTGDVEHVTWIGTGDQKADLLLIAPATANTISKIAHGIDDTPVTSFASVALGGHVPILLAPAMHAHMGENPAVRANLAQLRAWGVEVVEPRREENEEKVASPEEVAAAVLHRLGRGPWAGRRVIVIGGASHEPIDDVRSVTNESSGETAVALATQAHYRGALVSLWMGAATAPLPSFLPETRWSSVADLRRLVGAHTKELGAADAVWIPAALADYTVRARPEKIDSRTTPRLTLALGPAPKVLPEVRRRVPPPGIVVGFKLVSRQTPEELRESARKLLEKIGLDAVVGNDRAVMGSPQAEVLLLRRDGRSHWIRGPKSEVAGRLLDELGRDLAFRPLGGPARGPRSRTRRPRH